MPISACARPWSANSVNAYVRPIRSLAIWLVDEGILALNPFRRSRRRAALNPLLPSEETPTKSATVDDLEALERGCAGDRPIDLRDRAIVSILMTSAARNSAVRLLRVGDLDFERSVVRFRRGKGGKTLDIALQPSTTAVLLAYLERGRPWILGSADRGDPGWVFPSSGAGAARPLTMNALSLMLTRRYHAGGGSVRSFGRTGSAMPRQPCSSTTGCLSMRSLAISVIPRRCPPGAMLNRAPSPSVATWRRPSHERAGS
jgi:integrase